MQPKYLKEGNEVLLEKVIARVPHDTYKAEKLV